MLAQGVPQRWIAESAYEYERQVADGERVKVGVNKYTDDSDVAPPLFEIDADSSASQIRRLDERLAVRDEAPVRETLGRLARRARGRDQQSCRRSWTARGPARRSARSPT